MLTVGDKLPEFTVPVQQGTSALPAGETLSHDSFPGKWKVIFYWPKDFTFVCPSELIALDHRIPDFQARNVEVIGVSIDSHFTHNAWRNTPINAGGIGQVKYTLAADITHEICKAYDVEAAGGVAYRGAFLIDLNGVVRAQIVNDLPLGRSMDELLRLVDALQFTEEHGEVCPANWKKGDKGMTASPEGVAAYLSENASSL